MNNMRRGFTMIELIFVIVIIGILAAVAIPKMANTSKQALKSNVQSLVATMNNTVGPTMWLDQNRTDSLDCTDIASYIDPDGDITIGTADCGITGQDLTDAGVSVTFNQGTKVQAPTWTLD